MAVLGGSRAVSVVSMVSSGFQRFPAVSSGFQRFPAVSRGFHGFCVRYSGLFGSLHHCMSCSEKLATLRAACVTPHSLFTNL